MMNNNKGALLRYPTAADVNFSTKKRDRKNTGSGVLKAKRLARKAKNKSRK